jgi:oligopeptidase A
MCHLQNTFFPRWDEIKAEHVKPGILHIIEDLNKELTELEKNIQPTWSGLIEPVERITDRITRAWGTVSHLKSVKDTPELREAVDAVQGDRVKLSLRMSQSRPLYEAFQALKDGELWSSLTAAQKRIVETELRDFVLGGVALEGKVRFLAEYRSHTLVDSTVLSKTPFQLQVCFQEDGGITSHDVVRK